MAHGGPVPAFGYSPAAASPTYRAVGGSQWSTDPRGNGASDSGDVYAPVPMLPMGASPRASEWVSEVSREEVREFPLPLARPDKARLLPSLASRRLWQRSHRARIQRAQV